MEQPIASLNIPKNLIREVQSAGYVYCKDLNLTKICNITSNINALQQAPETKTALDIYQEEIVEGEIPSFIKELDLALRGGIPIGLITEISGEQDTCKTDICYHICVNVQLPSWCGGAEGAAIFIGTNKNFAVHRLKEVATACVGKYEFLKETCNHISCNYTFTLNSILEKIYYIYVNTVYELIACVKYIETWIIEHPKIKVIVIDTISAPFKQNNLEVRKHIYSVLNNLQSLARKHKFAVVLTNDMTTRINSDGAYKCPSLGDMYYHLLNNRIELRRQSLTSIKGIITKSPYCDREEFEFTL